MKRSTPPPQSSSCTATYHPSRKLSKLDEPDTRDTVREVGTNSWVMYSCGPLHMDEQRQDVQLEPTYSSSVPIRDVAMRIGRKQWTIGRYDGRESETSVLIAWYDDDDDDDILPINKQYYAFDLNGISTRLGLFYARRLAIIHWKFGFVLLYSCFLRVFFFILSYYTKSSV